ncbi:MAG: monovalent cation/H(+) antiporter subunit G [Oscillospiraceae bacterium]|jgi:multicomponent Na+:H+ antiporter subunit G|nr:monovalent cation/H(+) antiporter subunit G [Oscillospiraceae bacterium]
MMMREILAAIFIGLGILCCGIAMFGVYRMDYVLTRIHAAAIIDTLGTLLIFAGMIILRGFGWASAKIVLILVFQWLTSPVSTHRIGRVEVMTNPNLDKHCEVKR